MLAHPPEAGRPAYFHVSSGARNPLTFRRLYQSVHAYFDEHPFEVDDRGAVRLPDWRFPGAQSVERLLASSEKAHKVADYVIGHAPRGERTRDLARKLDQQGRRLEFLRRYLDLYREYAEAELRFDDAHTLALHQSLDDDDRERFALRHRRGRLGPLPPRGALPGGHRADPRARQGPRARGARRPKQG